MVECDDVVEHSTMAEKLITKDPEILSGAPVFRGTRVPVKTLIDYLAAGESIDLFLVDFPTVSRDQVIAFLQLAESAIVHESTP
ncbi:MAG: DUF433 domain-containing protein [Chloroflexi bacterium]|nr:DUF433 domain-containing protein [Chloroflexota bacterium]